MIQASLQLQDYWVNSIQVSANNAFEPGKPIDVDLSAIEVDSHVELFKSDNAEEAGTAWMVFLEISQSTPEGKNIPYEFKLDITGLVAAHPALKAEQLERAIQVNGPSMLFGAAREILRAATGRGPYAAVIIPSTNFFQRLPAKESLPANPQPELKGAKKAPRKEG